MSDTPAIYIFKPDLENNRLHIIGYNETTKPPEKKQSDKFKKTIYAYKLLAEVLNTFVPVRLHSIEFYRLTEDLTSYNKATRDLLYKLNIEFTLQY